MTDATPPTPSHGAPIDEMSADLNGLRAMLDETLRRQTADEFVELVNQVRSAEDLGAVVATLQSLDLDTASQLVRAFSIYFHLANVTEQTHQARLGQVRRANDDGPLARVTNLTKEAIEAGTIDPSDVARAVANLDVRPVFTAHPTEAARRSVLLKLRSPCKASL